MISGKELRARAKASLKGQYGKALGAVIVGNMLKAGGIFTLGPIDYGVENMFVSIQRGENPEFKRMFDGFSKYGKTFGAPLRRYILLALWQCVPVYGTIIKPLQYQMMWQVMGDEDVKSKPAIKKSIQLMKGYKKRMFGLMLYWTFISCLTLGIGTLFFLPFYYAGKAELYAQILHDNEAPQVAAPAAQEAAQ